MLHVLKSEVSIRGGAEGGVLGPLFLNFLDPPLREADQQTSEKRTNHCINSPQITWIAD